MVDPETRSGPADITGTPYRTTPPVPRESPFEVVKKKDNRVMWTIIAVAALVGLIWVLTSWNDEPESNDPRVQGTEQRGADGAPGAR